MTRYFFILFFITTKERKALFTVASSPFLRELLYTTKKVNYCIFFMLNLFYVCFSCFYNIERSFPIFVLVW